jgi:hypothetical protein
MMVKERLLLIAAGGVLLAVRSALWLLPFDTVRRALAATAPDAPAAGRAEVARAQRIGWAIERMGRRVPGGTCLTQALAADWLLRWFGHPTRVRFGAATDANGTFRAHAWLESGGRIIVGNLPDLASYRLLQGPADLRR